MGLEFRRVLFRSPFTPHITLAYYKPKNLTLEEHDNLVRAVDELNKSKVKIKLDTKNLVYSKFKNMNQF